MFRCLKQTRGPSLMAGALVSAMAVGPNVARAADIVISDGTFDTWKFASYLAGSANSSATMSLDKRAGNPAPQLVTTTVAGTGGTAGGYGWDVGTPINADLAGAKFTLTVQMKSGAGDRGAGQDIHLLVFQAGEAFASYWHTKTGKSRGKWKTVTVHGRLSGNDFNALQIGAGGPDFKDPVLTSYFGLYAQNTQTGQNVKNFYDNYTLTITPKQ